MTESPFQSVALALAPMESENKNMHVCLKSWTVYSLLKTKEAQNIPLEALRLGPQLWAKRDSLTLVGRSVHSQPLLSSISAVTLLTTTVLSSLKTLSKMLTSSLSSRKSLVEASVWFRLVLYRMTSFWKICTQCPHASIPNSRQEPTSKSAMLKFKRRKKLRHSNSLY